MNIDTDKLLENAIRDGIRVGIEKSLTGYHSPLDDLIKKSLQKNDVEFRRLLDDAIGSAVSDPEFKEQIKSSVRTTLARTLVQRFGGEIEKQVNALKSDPTTRARITLAIEEIVKTAS